MPGHGQLHVELRHLPLAVHPAVPERAGEQAQRRRAAGRSGRRRAASARPAARSPATAATRAPCPRGRVGPVADEEEPHRDPPALDLDPHGLGARAARPASAAANAGHLPHRGSHCSRSRTRSGYEPRLAVLRKQRRRITAGDSGSAPRPGCTSTSARSTATACPAPVASTASCRSYTPTSRAKWLRVPVGHHDQRQPAPPGHGGRGGHRAVAARDADGERRVPGALDGLVELLVEVAVRIGAHDDRLAAARASSSSVGSCSGSPERWLDTSTRPSPSGSSGTVSSGRARASSLLAHRPPALGSPAPRRCRRRRPPPRRRSSARRRGSASRPPRPRAGRAASAVRGLSIATAVANAAADAECPDGNDDDVGGLAIVW